MNQKYSIETNPIAMLFINLKHLKSILTKYEDHFEKNDWSDANEILIDCENSTKKLLEWLQQLQKNNDKVSIGFSEFTWGK